ncbi:MAG: hypothetical protein ICV65_16970 [Flavisolibacter sp.]|nr:hypothetical protein [Flavisolibacter sp.]
MNHIIKLYKRSIHLQFRGDRTWNAPPAQSPVRCVLCDDPNTGSGNLYFSYL